MTRNIVLEVRILLGWMMYERKEEDMNMKEKEETKKDDDTGGDKKQRSGYEGEGRCYGGRPR